MIELSINSTPKQLNPDKNRINISLLYLTGRLDKIYMNMDESILTSVMKIHIEINILQKVLIYIAYKPPI